jgi:transposase
LELPEDISLLKDFIVQLLSRIEELEAENALLQTQVSDLSNRLNQNSKNSNQPPSSDGLSKKPAFTQSKGKKSGGQLGHPGKTLEMVAQPDHIIVHHPLACPCCARLFKPSEVEQIAGKRQVFDLPDPQLVVTEHQLGLITCCGQVHRGQYPTDVAISAQYGAKIKSLSVLLNTDYKLPFEKIEQLLADLYACSFNESTAIKANLDCYERLEDIESTIKEVILSSEAVHFDETGMRVEGKLHWFHTASTVLFTYLFVHPHRGKKALQSAQSLLKDFKQWAIHDCWASYFDFKDCFHALCNAHILRELEALKENQSQWAAQMQELLLELFNLSQKATFVLPHKDLWLQKYQAICQTADREEPPPVYGKRGKPKNSKGRNLLNRLVEHQDAVLAFAFTQAIPFTNNQAERDIRCLKTKQKVATSFRTFKGAQTYARIQSFVSTLRKHNMNVFQHLNLVFNQQTIGFCQS